MYYTRLADADKALFRPVVDDIVERPLVMGYYSEAAIVVHADGTYHHLDVYGYDDAATRVHYTTVGRVHDDIAPSTWRPQPMHEKQNRPMKSYERARLSLVLDDWAALDRAPAFVQWSRQTTIPNKSGLRDHLPRIVVDPETGESVLYMAGRRDLAASFRVSKPAPEPTSRSRSSAFLIALAFAFAVAIALALALALATRRRRS